MVYPDKDYKNADWVKQTNDVFDLEELTDKTPRAPRRRPRRRPLEQLESLLKHHPPKNSG
jgi:hypothetical protein